MRRSGSRASLGVVWSLQHIITVMYHPARAPLLVTALHQQVIVFFPTARAAQFHAALSRAAGCPALDLHSRLSQSARDKAAAAFGGSPTGVMFASDVIARGLDFPDVSLVVQVRRARAVLLLR